MQTLSCLAYAKINLYLDILNRRRDGYHNIETIFQSISLADKLHFVKTCGGVRLECNAIGLSTGPDNLIIKALESLRKYTGTTHGVNVTLQKHIPIAAGLAGGSADAGATLVALNHLWGLHLPLGVLLKLGGKLGADIPFCISGGTAIATGKGDDLFPVHGHRFYAILIHPPVQVSTHDVYSSPYLPHNTEKPFAGRTATFRNAIRAYKQQDWQKLLHNSMERVVIAQHPAISKILDDLQEAGCIVAGMSGSGPTLFGICATEKQCLEVANKIHSWPKTIVHTVGQGIEIQY